MPIANVPLSNFAGGELSPLMFGRTDLPVYKRGVVRSQNFVLLPQGAFRYRTGTSYVHRTRKNRLAYFLRFQFNDQQAYLIEATRGYFRFYKENSIITKDVLTIASVSLGLVTTVTTAAGPYQVAEGEEVFLNNIVGPGELNGQAFFAVNVSGNSFQIQDSYGNYVSTATSSPYVSGGTAASIYEIRTPYREEDIATLQYSQNASLAYITHQNYEIRKLTRTAHTNWTLNRFTRVADPFDKAKDITAITKAAQGVVTASGHGFTVGQTVYFDSIVGMTELNYQFATVTAVTSTTFTIDLNTSGFTAYASGGKAELIGGLNYPRAVTFTPDSRVLYGGTQNKPESLWASRSPSTTAVLYDDFTTGTNPTDSFAFTLSPVSGQTNAIQWLSNTDKFIVAGTFGTVRRIYGASEQEAITPTAINAKSVNVYGAAQSSPISLGSTVFYIQRGKQKLRSFEYDYASDGYLTTDRNLVSDHITAPGLERLCDQQGSPDLIWGVRSDGVLLSLTYKDKEDISGWHRHLIGGSHVTDSGNVRPWGKVIDVESMARPVGSEQLWMVVERRVNGNTVRSVEYLTDAPKYPDELDFYSDEAGRKDDPVMVENYRYEIQKSACNLDMSLTYDGRSYGTAANASLTVAATTITSSQAVFDASMVGREIWAAFDENGEGGGQAVITGYTSPTQVIVETTVDFGKSVLTPGQWFLTTTTLQGLSHLEGENVGVSGDGGPFNDSVVSQGKVTLDFPASVVTVGLLYRGIFKTLNLDVGGLSGSAQSKPRNVSKVAIRFINSGGTKYGTSLYRMKQLPFRRGNQQMNRPIPLYNGIMEVPNFDNTEKEKNVFIVQDSALPCTITVLDVSVDTTDE